jgi:hypothetical protein
MNVTALHVMAIALGLALAADGTLTRFLSTIPALSDAAGYFGRTVGLNDVSAKR